MSAVLIFAENEHTREAIKSALADHIPLIVTEDHTQCMSALQQKAPIHKAFIGVSDENDLGIFEEISALKPGLKLIAVGDHNTENTAIEAVRVGASGYILLPAKAGEILATAR